jgi:thiamine pyrophosphate-dependent acetolactate synthase large subunit-like protein
VIKGRGSLQDIDQISLVKSIAKIAVTINRNCDIVPVLEHALRVAQSDVPGPVFVECPIDLLYSETLVREWYDPDKGMAKSTEGGLKSKLFRFYLKRHVDRMFMCDFDRMAPMPLEVRMPPIDPVRIAKAAGLLAKAKRPVLVVGSQALLQPARVGELAAAVDRIGMPVFLAGMARGLMGRSRRYPVTTPTSADTS